MAENQVNPLFNIHEKYREVIIINPYRFSDPDAVAQAARIVADGGTVVDFAFMNLVISTMKSMDIYTSCKLLTDANFGVKKNPSTGAVSKLYDISGNNNDAVQVTGTSQPIWSLVNGMGVINYDGVNDYLDLGNKSQFDFGTSDFSILVKYFANNPSSEYSILSKGNIGAQTSGYKIFKFKYLTGYYTQIKIGNGTIFTSANDDGTFPQNTIQSLVGVRSGLNVLLYRFGVLLGSNSGSSINGNSSTYNLNVGRCPAGSEYMAGQINSSTIFNISLSQSQITQLTNLGL